MKSLVTLILFFILLSFQDFAQERNSYKLMGSVVDSVSGASLQNINVTIISRKDGKVIGGATTNAKGYYEIEKIPERVIRAKFSIVGYQTKIIDSISLENTSRIGIVKLFETTIVMPDVVVETIKPMIEFKADKQIINIDQAPGNNGSLTDVLNNSGLVDVDPQSKSISVRGQAVRLEKDGHPFKMPDNTLSQLPAAMFDQVEVVLSPGARESAEGGTYILNIITKKSAYDNISGSLNINVASNQNNYGGLNVNYKVNKLNIFISSLGYFSKFIAKSIYEKDNYNATSFHYLNSNSSTNSDIFFGNIESGFDYNLDENNTFTFVGSYNRQKDNKNTTGNGVVENNLSIPEYSLGNLSNLDDARSNYTLYGFYKKKFGKSDSQSALPEKELTFDAYFSNIYNRSFDDLNTMYSYQPDLPQLINSGTVENANTFIFKVEYVVPSEIGTFETGYNFTYRHRQDENNSLDYSYLTNTWQDSLGLSNLFRYKENIHAGYISYSEDFGKFGSRAGCRMEYLSTEENQITTDQNYDHCFLNFFPNLDISYRINEFFQIYFNAFRRVKYPELYYVNPYKIYTGPNSFKAGNPDLQPSYTNSYALGLSQYINAYYSFSSGLYQYVMANLQDSISNIYPVNLNSNKIYGVDLSLPYYNSPMALFHLPDCISMINIRFTYRYSKTTGNYLNEDLSDWGYSKSLNASLGLKLWYDIDANMYFTITPRTESKMYINNQYSYSMISFRKSFLNEKLEVSLSVNDILNSNKYDYQTFGTDFYLHNISTMQNSQAVRLNIIYMFNNYQQRPERNIDDGRDAADKSNR